MTYALNNALANGLAAGQQVTETFNVSASDGSLVGSKDVSFTIEGRNDAPVVTFVRGGSGDPLLVPENTAGSFATITAADPDAGQTLTFSIGPSANPSYDNEVFTIDPVTGALRFTAPPDFEFTDPGNDDLYKVAVQVSDGAGGTATRDVFVQVTNVNGISPPPSNAATIVGTNEEDSLIGLGGANTLLGLGGNDILNGGGGNDLLDGGTGIDVMLGGAGSDTYVVDSTGDRVYETTTTTSTIDAGGIDTVQSSVGFTLNADAGVRLVEYLTLTGTANIDGTGNALANQLTGNAGNNMLNGGVGNDTLLGGAGNDTYVVDSTGDRVFETTTTTSTIDAGGIDTVQSSVVFQLNGSAGVRLVENLTLTGTASIDGYGNALGNRLTGNAGINYLTGQIGNDTLDGGLGNDRLLGGAGNDTFVFNTAIGIGNVDQIPDFSVVYDTIGLNYTVFAGLAPGTLGASAFSAHPASQAATSMERITYETDTGRLFYDSDGVGGAARVQFATLSAGLALTNADFFVF